MRNISKILKNGRRKARTIGLPFIIERIMAAECIKYEPDPLNIKDLIREGVLRQGLENKAKAFSLSEPRISDVWLRDGNTATFDPYHRRELYAVTLYMLKR